MTKAAIAPIMATDHHSSFLETTKAFALLPVGLVLVIYLACRERW